MNNLSKNETKEEKKDEKKKIMETFDQLCQIQRLLKKESALKEIC